jgi:DnaJ-class molecular chaperone
MGEITCKECDGKGFFENRSERRREACKRCGGDGEQPLCPKCNIPGEWQDDERGFRCFSCLRKVSV